MEKFKKYFTPLGIKIDYVLNNEKFKGVSYVGQFPLAGWNDAGDDLVFFDRAVDVFYNPIPDTSLGHKNYFAVYVRNNKAYICDASYVVYLSFTGIEDIDGNIMYARYQHDFRYTEDGSRGVDGGSWILDTETGYYTMWGRTLGWPSSKSITVSNGNLIAKNLK